MKMSYYEYREPAAPSLEYLLEQKEEEISSTWFMIQNEAECDLEDADVVKMANLLEELKRLEEDKANLCEAIDRRNGEW
jgi:RNA polymerase-interacting CarD/CdnL/TRCF family regulator